LADKGGQHLLDGELAIVARIKGPIPPVLPAAKEKDLDAGLAALLVGGDHVGIDEAGDVDVLVALHQRERADAVADHRRRLEIAGIGGGLHLAGEALQHGVALAGEKGARLFGQGGIAVAVDLPDAGRAAPLDLIEQARAGAVGEDAVAARAQQERLLQRDQRAVDRAGRGERAEIAAGPGLRAAVLGDLREVVAGGQMDERKGFVVAQQDVEAGHQPLDHVAFEQQRLRLGGGDDDLQHRGLGHHAPQPVRQPGRVGVGLHAVLQAARLADIERLALLVEHAVDAGTGRHRPERGTDHRNPGQ
jgi:hypothetical protein